MAQYPRSRTKRRRRLRPGPVPLGAAPAPVPTPAALAQVERQPCDPGAHTPWLDACPACQAWEQGQVLLADGTTVPKTTWVMAHEYPS